MAPGHRRRPAVLAAAVLAIVLAVPLAGCSGGSSGGAATSTGTVVVTDASPPGSPTSSGTSGTSSGTSSAPTGQLVEVTVAGGKVSGPGRAKVRLGSTVTLRVTSDVADEIHLHGYDKHADVAAGGTADLTFTADQPGVFEVELESRALQLVQLQVQ